MIFHAQLSVVWLLQAYRGARSAGVNDIRTILLDIGSELQTFDFTDTFTSSFDVRRCGRQT